MDPLIPNGIEPVLLRELEKRDDKRDPATRRKRPPVPEKPVEPVDENEDENEEELAPDTPKHVLDDLA